MKVLTPLLVSVLVLAACAAQRTRRDIALTPPAELCRGVVPQPGGLCMPVARLEQLLKQGDMDVLQARPTSRGTNGAMTLWLRFPQERVVLKAKWKEAARNASALNNEPRKELAAYERATDEQAMDRGCAEGLSQMRDWVYTHCEGEVLEEKKRDYYSPDEIDAWVLANPGVCPDGITQPPS